MVEPYNYEYESININQIWEDPPFRNSTQPIASTHKIAFRFKEKRTELRGKTNLLHNNLKSISLL